MLGGRNGSRSKGKDHMGLDSPRIYVDLDDVLCETARAFLGILERDYGKTVDFEDIAWFDLGRSFELEPPVLEDFMRKVHEPEVLSAMKPVDGAVASRFWVDSFAENIFLRDSPGFL